MDVRGELALWRAVICQAIRDAKDGGTKALRWLRGDDPDFRKVCDLAGIDIGLLKKRLDVLIKRKNS
jgi:hypothetical protein